MCSRPKLASLDVSVSFSFRKNLNLCRLKLWPTVPLYANIDIGALPYISDILERPSALDFDISTPWCPRALAVDVACSRCKQLEQPCEALYIATRTAHGIASLSWHACARMIIRLARTHQRDKISK
jgi:hypothetical protein